MCKNSYHKYDIYVAPKSEYATDEVLKVSIDGDDEHTSIAVVEIAGLYIGIGHWRPGAPSRGTYGRFSVEKVN